jgi:hypothetical protein
MKKIKLIVELEYDEKLMYSSKEGEDWFFNEVLKDDLELYSEEIGDNIGKIVIKEISK